jgi:hypothetical protein
MELLKKTPVDLWTTDLDKFAEEWEVSVVSSIIPDSKFTA